MTHRLLSAALPVLLLAACDVTLPWSSIEPPAGPVSLDTSSVSFAAFAGDSGSGVKTVGIAVNGRDVAGLGVEGSAPWLHLEFSGTPANPSLRLFLASVPGAPGDYELSVAVHALDAAGRSLGSASLAVTLRVAPVPSAPGAVDLTWMDGAPPAAGEALGAVTLAHDPHVSVGDATPTVPWLDVSRSGDAITLRANAATGALGPGRHAGQVQVTVSVEAHARTVSIPVVASVRSPLSVPDQLSISIGPASTGAELVSRSTLTTTRPTPISFTASADVPWLTASGGATGSPDNLEVRVSAAALESLANGDHLGTVVVTPADEGLAPIPIPVVLTLRLPQVTSVEPPLFVDQTATAEVVVRGSGFLAPGATPSVGGTPPASFYAVSDTELRLVPGTRTAGDHAVTFPNALGVARAAGTLVVVAPPAPSPVAVSWVQGAPPAAGETLATVTVTHDPHLALGAVRTAVPWLQVSRTGDVIALRASAGAALLPVGTHEAAISLDVTAGTSLRTATLLLRASVHAPLVVSETVAFRLLPTSTPEDLVSRVTVTSTLPSPVTFTAATDVPWLAATGGATGTPENLELTIVPAAVAALAVGEHTAVVTLTPTTAGQPPLEFPVALEMLLPEVHLVAPVIQTDRVATDRVIVRGKGFSAPGAAPTVNGAAPASFTLVSDTELSVVAGALSAGAYEVACPNALGLERPTATLHVVEPPPYAEVTVEAAFGSPEWVIVSARHRTVYGIAPTSALTQFRFDEGSGSWTATRHGWTAIWSAALTLDEETLVVLTSTELRFLDPVTLATRRVVALPGTPSGTYVGQLAATHDGLVLIQSLRKAWSLREERFVDIPWMQYGVGLGASRDGSRVVFGEATNGGEAPYRYYDASTGTATASETRLHFAWPKVSGRAERVFVNSYLLDRELHLLETLPVFSSGTDLSPDGTRAYGYSYAQRLHRLDLTTTPATEGTPIDLPYLGSDAVRVAADPGGAFVFVIGSARMRVVDVR